MSVTGTVPIKIIVPPIEITTAEAIRDALLSLPANERGFIATAPGSGGFRVVSIQRKASGETEYKWSDVPEA
ncbi:unnamed protein product [marine sediment metagenome]|uniref:Uncharacterized protein n=1 Tax=marine sediment metagenome TaxID=412755 RepID=X1UHI1_9ZZZZ